MKTYLLKYLRPNIHTFHDIIISDFQKDKERKLAEINSEIASLQARALKEKDDTLRRLHLADADKLKSEKKDVITDEDRNRFGVMAEDIMLHPGINEVSEEHYLLMKSHPSFDRNFDTRPPVMAWVPGFGPEDEKMKDFKALKDNEALDISESMWNKPMIEKYLVGEKREKVKASLEKQLDKLKIKPSKAA